MMNITNIIRITESERGTGERGWGGETYSVTGTESLFSVSVLCITKESSRKFSRLHAGTARCCECREIKNGMYKIGINVNDNHGELYRHAAPKHIT